MKKIAIPKVDVNTERVLVNKWLVRNFDHIEKEVLIAIIETSKTAVDVQSPASGYFFTDKVAGEFVPITQPLGFIFETLEECKKYASRVQQEIKKNHRKKTTGSKATKKARERAAEYAISIQAIDKKGLITEKDVLNHIRTTHLPAKLHSSPLRRRTKSVTERIMLIGGGRASTQVIEILSFYKQKQVVGILDDTPEKWGTRINGIPVCGPTSLIKGLFDDKAYDAVIIAISTSVIARERYRLICSDLSIPLGNALHPTASISPSVTMGTGNVVCAFCHFGNDTVIGDNNFISAFNSYDHHNIIGNNISTGPGCMVSGSVTIGDNVRFGAGIFVEPLLEIGHDVAIASGSIITSSIDPESVVKRKVSSIIVSKKDGF